MTEEARVPATAEATTLPPGVEVRKLANGTRTWRVFAAASDTSEQALAEALRVAIKLDRELEARYDPAAVRRAEWRAEVLSLLADHGGTMTLAKLAEAFGAQPGSIALRDGLAALAAVEIDGELVRLRADDAGQR